MGQSGVHEIGFGKRNYLGFILQTSEGCGENDSVIIDFEAQTQIVLFFAQSFAGVALAF